MNIDTDSLVTFLITWGIPTFMVVRTYLKMDSDDRNSAKKDFKSAHFVFTIGSLVIGYFFASIGNLLTLNIIKLPGIFLMIIAGITITVDMWRKNKAKSMLTPILIAVAIFFLIKP
ncbi:hypothetical protein M662_07630 [Bacillus sp. SB49]|uniref:hypothetical protein n=1 Tax=Bacillaceae TaxID=186817 RepID=UPI0002A4FE52|nr:MULTISPECIES: hypothetical protein [Bacillaceae]ELK44287.1 hypothetical protein D479_19838 [Halobacillus sp. BAB-2008]QHT46369.1 hypothetical protein M662_07630 [Bacillus sp. SB49]